MNLAKLVERHPLGMGGIIRLHDGGVAREHASLANVVLIVNNRNLTLDDPRDDEVGVVLTFVVPNPDDGVFRHGVSVA